MVPAVSTTVAVRSAERSLIVNQLSGTNRSSADSVSAPPARGTVRVSRPLVSTSTDSCRMMTSRSARPWLSQDALARAPAAANRLARASAAAWACSCWSTASSSVLCWAAACSRACCSLSTVESCSLSGSVVDGLGALPDGAGSVARATPDGNTTESIAVSTMPTSAPRPFRRNDRVRIPELPVACRVRAAVGTVYGE